MRVVGLAIDGLGQLLACERSTHLRIEREGHDLAEHEPGIVREVVHARARRQRHRPQKLACRIRRVLVGKPRLPATEQSPVGVLPKAGHEALLDDELPHHRQRQHEVTRR